jgi:hypothetical protein
MRTDWRLDDYDEDKLADLVRAARMYEHVRTGGALQPLDTRLRLDQGEEAYADEELLFARYFGGVAFQERPWSYLSPLAVISSAFRNWNARQEAESRWRVHRHVRAVLTDRRLLISVDGQWITFPHAMVVEFLPAPAEFQVTLAYHDSLPLRLSGRSAATLGVALAAMLCQPEELTGIPEFDILDEVLDEVDS